MRFADAEVLLVIVRFAHCFYRLHHSLWCNWSRHFGRVKAAFHWTLSVFLGFVWRLRGPDDRCCEMTLPFSHLRKIVSLVLTASYRKAILKEMSERPWKSLTAPGTQRRSEQSRLVL
jgi:hypothetical protein